LPYILAGIHEYSFWTLLLYGLTFSLILIALRMIWVFPGAYVSVWIRRKLLRQHVITPDVKSIFVVSWAGMRGVLALAAAFSLPQTLSDGRPFAQRNLILFLTFSIILVTLVGQGLSLPPLIRLLGLAGNRESEQEERIARCAILTQAIASLEHQRDTATEDEAHDIEDLLHRYRHRLEAVAEKEPNPDSTTTPHSPTEISTRQQRLRALILNTLAVERRSLNQLREDGSIGDEVLRRLERELDLTETNFETQS